VTFTEIQTAIQERLNLTSSEAAARIGRRINDRYRRVTSSVGLSTSRRTTDSQSTVIGNQRLTFALEKLEVVYTVVNGKRRVLDEISYDEWRNLDTYRPATGSAYIYAIETSGASTVTIVLDYTPDAIEVFKADGLGPAAVLSGTAVPAFAADFHDALVFGGMADEYRKLENFKAASEMEALFEGRVSELRYFIAKSIYLQPHQGGSGTGGFSPPRYR
jgi:hypothetical protein